MNRMKKFMAMLLAVILVAQCGFTTFATENEQETSNVALEKNEVEEPEAESTEEAELSVETGPEKGLEVSDGTEFEETPGTGTVTVPEAESTEEKGLPVETETVIESKPAEDPVPEAVEEEETELTENPKTTEEEDPETEPTTDIEPENPAEEPETESAAPVTKAMPSSVNLMLTSAEEANVLSVDGAVTFYVDDDADATGDGTVDAPFSTIQSAVDAVMNASTEAEAGTKYVISVAEGTYQRFFVPLGAEKVTIQGSGDGTVVETFNGSELAAEAGRKYDGQGIIIYGADITLKDLKITSEEATKGIWYASAVGSHNGDTGERNNTAITLENITFAGSGKGYAVMPQRSRFTMKDCQIDNYEQAVYVAGDTFACYDWKIEDNEISNCIYAIHGYFGGTPEEEMPVSMSIKNNTISGTEDRFAVIALMDQHNGNSLKMNIEDNTFSYTIVGGINQNADDVIQGGMEGVKTSNTFKDYSFVVDATYLSDEEYSSTYYVPDYDDAQILTWYADPYSEVNYEMYKAFWHYLDENGASLDNPLVFNEEDQASFQMAKNALIITQTGNLEIEKKVTNNILDNSTFTFEVQLYDKDDINMEEPLKLGLYKCIDADGNEAVTDLQETGGIITVQVKAGEKVEIERILPGTICKVTEVTTDRYEAEEKELTATIAGNETGTVTFLNKYIPQENPGAEPEEWDTSKSKTATNLDENYESEVTLSLPSSEEKLVSDVVFVLDKSTSTDVEDQAIEMLNDLNTQIKNTDATVKVGVIIFNQEANNVLQLTELNDNTISNVEQAIRTTIRSGTNTHAGLLAGISMLENDKNVDDSRKYLVFVSDCITYMYNEDATAIALENGDHTSIFAGPDNWTTKYGNSKAPSNWSEWLKDIEVVIQKDNGIYDYPYEQVDLVEGAENYISYEDRENHATSVDKALYLTYQSYQEAAVKYHCYAMEAQSNASADNPWATSFLGHLAGGKEITFDTIQNDIYYLLDAGSKVVDEIGFGDDYNFDFVNKMEKLTLTVNGKAYTTARSTKELNAGETARYIFTSPGVTAKNGAEAPYVLHYYADGAAVKGTVYGECFVWDINVPVSNFAPVQLTYSVKLTNPKTEAGDYGQYDADGSEQYEGLYTNNSATLYPVDSNGEEGTPEDFNKPTVSYHVQEIPETPVPEEPEAGTAKLKITKKVQNSKGEAKKVNASFYVSIFTDDKYQNRYGDVIELNLAETSEATVAVNVETPADGSSRTYYVMETDKDGNVVSSGKEFGYQISIKGSQATVSKTADSAEIVIINQQVKSGGGSHGGSGSSGSDSTENAVSNQQQVGSAKTGDTSQIILYIVLAAAAATALGVCGIAVYKKRRLTK